MRTKQPGMGGALAEALRYWVGDIPTSARKRELKEPTLSNPTRKQISVMVRLAARSRSLARSIRRRVRYVLGVSPYALVNARAKWNLERCAACAIESRVRGWAKSRSVRSRARRSAIKTSGWLKARRSPTLSNGELRSVGDRVVADLEHRVEDLEPLVELGLAYAQRRVGHDDVPAHERVHARVEQGLADRFHLRRRAVERCHRFEGVAIAHELEGAEQSDRPRGTDAGMALLQPAVVLCEHHAHTLSVADHVVLFVRLDRAQRRGAAERVAVVREAAIEDVVVEIRRHCRPHAHRAQRHIAAGQALRQRDQVGDHAPVIDREPPTSASEARHHLVADEQDSVPIADLSDALEIAVGRDQDAV